ISAHANVKLSDNTGSTALHFASLGNRPDAVELLLKNGAGAKKRDKNGKTPGDIAREKGFNNLANTIDNFTDTTASNKPATNAPTPQPTVTSSTVQISNASNTLDQYSDLLVPGVVISIVIIVAVLSAAVLYVKKRKNKVDEGLPLEDLPQQQSGPGMGSRHDSENSLYGVVHYKTESQVPTRGSQHESDNSLYGATVA
ncbi:unnamed protein product, partial [Meganyctiphanes norvegica]